MTKLTRLTVGSIAITSLSFALALYAPKPAASKDTVLPNPCKAVTRIDAQALLGLKVQPATNLGRGCMYTAYPTGPVGQVEIYVDSSLPRTLQIDRGELHHKFWNVPHIGDQTLEEEWTIFTRKGKVWLTIHVTRLDSWPLYQKRLERTARTAISRVSPPVRKTAGAHPSHVSKDPPATGGRERWSARERHFGGSITRYTGVVFQPNVVLIGGGAAAIRAVSPDGLTWTIAATAPGASDLRVGKVMVATTLATGRVLKITRKGSNLEVVLGPVALTDIIRDGTFRSIRPVPLSKPLVYQQTLPKTPPTSRRRTQGVSSAGQFSATPFCCEGGLGVHISYHNAAGRLSATVSLHASRPTVDFSISIGGGHLVDASFQLKGFAGLKYDIWGATENGSGDVKSGPIAVPESMTIPLAGPLAITLTQSFDVSMQLVGQAQLKAAGDYKLVGNLGFVADTGGARRNMVSMSTDTPMDENTLSLGVGPNAISLGWAIRATVGVGGLGFAAGAWGQLRAGLAVGADGSHLQSLEFGCTTVGLDVDASYGVGFSVPEFVRSIINAILSVVRVKPIPASGGPSWGPFTVWHPPRAEWCPKRK